MKSLLEAVGHHYAEEELEDVSIGGKRVEVQKRRSARKDFTSLVLDGRGIGCGNDQGEVEDVCGHVLDLDLTDNVLSEVNEIWRICSGMQDLQSLVLDGNTFATEPSPLQFTSLSSLSLQRTLLQPQQFQDVVSCLPALAILDVAFNQLSSLSLSHGRIHTLHAQHNQLTSIPSLDIPLQKLFMANNRITSFSGMTALPMLISLDVSENEIRDPSTLTSLNTQPLLVDLRVLGNPFYVSSKMDARDDVIARCSHLQTLNGSTISAKDRDGAEILFVKSSAAHSILRDELSKKHGVDARDPEANDSTLASQLREMDFVYRSTRKTRRIPPSMPIASLRAYASRLFSLPPQHVKLRTDTLDEMDIMQQLDYYTTAYVYVDDH